MNVLNPTRRRAPMRALAGVTGIALAIGVALAPAAHATVVPADAAHTGLYGAASPAYDGVFRQSLAVLGIHAAGEEPAAIAVTWLKHQQCADGGFTSFDPTPDGVCPAVGYDPANPYAGGEDVDSTALAAQALRATGQTTAAAAAEAWLVSQQSAVDGGWGTYGTNPNSSGLALMALDAGGVTPTHDPAPYFASFQIGRTGTPDEADKGGIAAGSYSPNTPDAYATMQSVPGIGGSNLVDVPTPSVNDWTRGVTVPSVTPPATAGAIADWAATWLSTQTSSSTFATDAGARAWAVLSFATTATARDAAEAQYTSLQTSMKPANPGQTGLAALAATALRETSDARRYATLTAATLTPATGRDSTAPATWSLAPQPNSVWVGSAVTVLNPVAPGIGVTQTVRWGDGAIGTLTGRSLSHTYARPGFFQVTVTIKYGTYLDDARVTAGYMGVRKDTTDPRAMLAVPSAANHVASWKTVRGTATDNGLGVWKVTVRLVEKRSGAWYSYDGSIWTKRASYASAKSHAERVGLSVSSTGAWSTGVKHLAKGTLKVRYTATDRAGNTSATKTVTQSLTRK